MCVCMWMLWRTDRKVDLFIQYVWMLCGFDGAVCRGTYMMFCEAVAQCVLEVRVRRSVPVKDVCVVFFNLFFCVILDRLLKCYMFVFIRP